MKQRVFLAVLLSLLAAGRGRAQSLTGIVLLPDGTPAVGVTATCTHPTLMPAGVSATTDTGGVFRISLPPGRWTVAVSLRSIGNARETVEITRDAPINILLRLSPLTPLAEEELKGLPPLRSSFHVPGIQPLTEATYREAVADGERGDDGLAYTALLAVRLGARTPTQQAIREAMRTVDPKRLAEAVDFPYTLALYTPYRRLQWIAYEAGRRYEPLNAPPLSAFAPCLAEVEASPSSSGPLSTLTSVERVVLRRAGQVLQPTAAQTVPTMYQNGFGAVRTADAGRFFFPCDAFDPAEDVTIIIVGSGQNREWTLYRDELAQLK